VALDPGGFLFGGWGWSSLVSAPVGGVPYLVFILLSRWRWLCWFIYFSEGDIFLCLVCVFLGGWRFLFIFSVGSVPFFWFSFSSVGGVIYFILILFGRCRWLFLYFIYSFFSFFFLFLRQLAFVHPGWSSLLSLWRVDSWEGFFSGRAFLSSREMALMSGRWCLLIFLVISVARVLDLYSFAADYIQWWYRQQCRSTPPHQRGSELESPSMHRCFPVNNILQTAENKRRLPLICCSFPLLLLIQCRFIHLFCRWCWVVLGGGIWGGLLFFFFASFYALILLPFFLFFIFIILFLIRVVIVMHLTVHPLLGFLFSR